VFVHTCRCIFLIVLIWFISGGKLFQELFENVFEVLEKKKEKQIISFSYRAESPVFPRALLLGPAAPSLLGRAEASERSSLLAVGRPSCCRTQAAAPPSPFLWLIRRAHATAASSTSCSSRTQAWSPTLLRLPSPLPWPARLAALK
jgi:hypothetical protein